MASYQTMVHQHKLQSSNLWALLSSLYSPSWCSTGLSPVPIPVSTRNGPNSSSAEFKIMWPEYHWFIPWCFSHADDVRTLSTSISDARDQINQVQNFASSRGLVLNAYKCEAIVSPSIPASLTSIDVDGLSIPINNSAICLGSWWTPNLSCKKWIESNIKKARGAFLQEASMFFMVYSIPSPPKALSSAVLCLFFFLVLSRGS